MCYKSQVYLNVGLYTNLPRSGTIWRRGISQLLQLFEVLGLHRRMKNKRGRKDHSPIHAHKNKIYSRREMKIELKKKMCKTYLKKKKHAIKNLMQSNEKQNIATFELQKYLLFSSKYYLKITFPSSSSLKTLTL